MVKRFPIAPAHPERTCWGCDRYCSATELACGNGSERTQHPAELFGTGWAEWGLDPFEPAPGEPPDAINASVRPPSSHHPAP